MLGGREEKKEVAMKNNKNEKSSKLIFSRVLNMKMYKN
jgi:hypothetical protein